MRFGEMWWISHKIVWDATYAAVIEEKLHLLITEPQAVRAGRDRPSSLVQTPIPQVRTLSPKETKGRSSSLLP